MGFCETVLINALFFSSLATFAKADWQFHSRPDLSPPKLNVTISSSKDLSPGYLFIAPYSGYFDNKIRYPRQPGPYIFTDEGELVWSGFGYISIWAANFQAGKINGEDVLFSFEGSHNPNYGHGHGHVTVLNSNYETVKEIRAANHKVADKHEFHIIDEKTGLIEIYQPVPRDLKEFGANPEQRWIIDSIIQEIDLETGNLLFEWSSLDHISPAESVLPITEGQAGYGYNSSDAWDYFHINSVDKDEEGSYLISSRDTSSIYKINGSTGDIIWKLGGIPKKTSTSFKSSNFNFSFQHHARYLSTSSDRKSQIISFYDNEAHGTEHKDGSEVHYGNHSSGKIIEVNTSSWEAKLLKQYNPPDDLLSKSQGSTQVLPNGNVLVNWGSSGAVTEFKSDGTPIFHAYLDSNKLDGNIQNYRAFKYNWTGNPKEEIALVWEGIDSTKSVAYVSWNGDTRTAYWRFSLLSTEDDKKILKNEIRTVQKSGFETSVEYNSDNIGKDKQIIVEALDKDGRLIITSRPVTLIPQVIQYDTEEKNLAGVFDSHGSGFQTYFSWRVAKETYDDKLSNRG
ncbi:Secreted protein [Schizosaccharomyces pombe]